jgi:hypothetical protein
MEVVDTEVVDTEGVDMEGVVDLEEDQLAMVVELE